MRQDNPGATAALAVVPALTSALPTEQARPFFSPEQEKLIRDTFLSGASAAEGEVLLEVARARKLSPILGQIHFVKRNQWDAASHSNIPKWSCQVAIDGFRIRAERTGLYDGSDEATWVVGEDNYPRECRVVVHRRDRTRPIVATTRFSEYAQFTRDNKLTKMWAEKPFMMLEKCAEAAALRKAFPEEFGGLYEPAELMKEQEVLQGDAAPVLGATIPKERASAPGPSTPVAKGDTSEKAAAEVIDASSLDAELTATTTAKELTAWTQKVSKAYVSKKIVAAEREALLARWKIRKAELKAALATSAPSNPSAPASSPDAEKSEVPDAPASAEVVHDEDGVIPESERGEP